MRRLPGFLMAYGLVYAVLVSWWGGMRTLLAHGSLAATVAAGLGLPVAGSLVAWELWARWADRKEGR
jgi:hypothetical protein